MRILAIIPARGGSKGVPGKNIKLLGGKPLLQYTYESAQSSLCISRIILSSEDEKIIACAQSIGLEVPFVRPIELSQDSTPTISVIQHAVKALAEHGEHYDAVLILQVTSPFRRTLDIDNAIKRYIDSQADSLISVLKVPHEYNPHWCFESDENGFLQIATGEKTIIPRRQQLPQSFHRDGSIYIVSTGVLMNCDTLFGEKIAFYEMAPERYVNIDTMQDWEKAEMLINKKFINE